MIIICTTAMRKTYSSKCAFLQIATDHSFFHDQCTVKEKVVTGLRD